PLPSVPVPPILRVHETHPPGPFRPARVRLHVLDARDRAAASWFLEGGRAERLPGFPGADPRLLFECVLRPSERSDDGGEGMAGGRSGFRPRRGPLAEGGLDVVSGNARSDPPEDRESLRRLPAIGLQIRPEVDAHSVLWLAVLS